MSLHKICLCFWGGNLQHVAASVVFSSENTPNRRSFFNTYNFTKVAGEQCLLSQGGLLLRPLRLFSTFRKQMSFYRTSISFTMLLRACAPYISCNSNPTGYNYSFVPRLGLLPGTRCLALGSCHLLPYNFNLTSSPSSSLLLLFFDDLWSKIDLHGC